MKHVPIPDVTPTFIGGTVEEAKQEAQWYYDEHGIRAFTVSMSKIPRHLLGCRPDQNRFIFCGSYSLNKHYHDTFNLLTDRNYSIEYH